MVLSLFAGNRRTARASDAPESIRAPPRAPKKKKAGAGLSMNRQVCILQAWDANEKPRTLGNASWKPPTAFLQDGDVGVDRIIAEAGAKMSLYKRFPSKDDLIPVP
ncbi:MAG: hypothetical protein U0793_16535 [Gemmataceae bacterium]